MQDIYFKEGDKVSHQAYGNGIVKFTNYVPNSSERPVTVDFDAYEPLRRFLADGRESENNLYPSLFQGHDRFNPQPNKPIFEPKQGDLVWAKFDDSWFVGYFLEFDQFNIPLIGIRKNTAVTCRATQIRPFKGEIPND